MDDLIFKYNLKVSKLRSNISQLNTIGFKLDNEQKLIDDVDSDISRKINLLEDDDKKELLIQDAYTKALEKLEEIELSQYNYYKVYNDCEDIIKLLRNVDINNIDEIIKKAMSLLEAIREGLIIVSYKDRYLLEKVFKTIYEVLKVSFLYGKGKQLYSEINKVEFIKPYIRDCIKTDMKKIEKRKQIDEFKKAVKREKSPKDELGMDIIAAIAVFESTKIKEKNKAERVHEVITENKKAKLEELKEEKKEEKKSEIIKPGVKKAIGIGLISEEIIKQVESKINVEESNKLVEGDEKIVLPENKKQKLEDDKFFEEFYLDDYNNTEEDNLNLFYDEDQIEEFDKELEESKQTQMPPIKIQKELKETQEFNYNWFNLDLLSFLLKGANMASKIMLMTLLGNQKAKSLMKHMNKKNLLKEKEKPKQKKLDFEEIKKMLR